MTLKDWQRYPGNHTDKVSKIIMKKLKNRGLLVKREKLKTSSDRKYIVKFKAKIY